MYIKAGELFGTKTVFAGELMKQKKKPDRVSQIREQAQKKAHKIVSDVFASEKQLDDMIQEMKNKCQEMLEEQAEASREIERTQERQAAYMDAYGVTSESDQYRDLELLRKERAAKTDLSVALTEEENTQLSRIHEEGITNFQKDMLEQDEIAEVYRVRMETVQQGITQINSSLYDIRIERLKVHPMADANKQVKKVMEQASDEIIGEIRSEGMKHIEDKLQEVVEKAKEEAAEKEEEKEKLETRKERKEELEKIREGDSDSETAVSKRDIPKVDMDILDSYKGTKKKADQELERLIDQLEMIMEDLKGIDIDVNL